MMGGTTALVTLLRPKDRVRLETEDQQYHVLPLYVPDCSEEDKFQRTIATRETKKSNCKRGQINPEQISKAKVMIEEKVKVKEETASQ